MTRLQTDPAAADDIDLRTLGRALWRAKGWILGLAVGAGVITFIALSMLRPLFTSEARILVQNEDSAFTRPASEAGRDLQPRTLDEQAIQSQVQVLSSRDLAVEVIDKLDLTDNPEFAKDAGSNIFVRLLNRFGLFKGTAKSQEEKAANAFAEHLSVFQLTKSSVIGVDYSSGDAPLAAKIANELADAYIKWQREAALEQTKDATAWLSAQIDALRKKVADAEGAAERFRASQGLFSGSNNVNLNAQQLSELNSQLILAKAQKSEAEARARQIKKMLADNGDIDATPEVLKSELIGRLIDQRVQVQRQLAELSATLMPAHPRIKQLNSELADVRAQVRAEATNVLKSLENESEVASARETSLRASLNDAKTQASGVSEAEIKLRALEREAKAERDLLESYLARYRDASARHDMGAVPAQAAIVSRAHASLRPSFPKRGPLSLLAAVATALLALAYVLARELIGAPAPVRQPVSPAVLSSHDRRRRSTDAPKPGPPLVPAATEPMKAERSMPISTSNAESEATPADTLRMPQAEPQVDALAEKSVAVATGSAVASSRPSSLSMHGAKAKDAKPGNARQSSRPHAMADTAIAPQSAAGFLERLRRGLSPAANETQTVEPQTTEGWRGRMRANANQGEENAARMDPSPLPSGSTGLRTNDLRHYLNQRLAASAAEAANDPGEKDKSVAPKKSPDRVGPVLKSLDAVLNQILASGKGAAPRALMVAGASAKTDATLEAISIARGLVARREQVVLVDLTRGPAAVSGPLKLPRAPGLTDIAAERVGFEDVVRIDSESSLQVIPAGNPKLTVKGDENERFAQLFEALMQTYDCVVLHADGEAMRNFTPALKFELPLVVAVLPAPASASKPDLSDFAVLGCPVLVYEPSGKEPRKRLFGRVAAI